MNGLGMALIFGATRKGWIRFGHWLSGIASSDVTVNWDGQPA